LLIVIGSQKQIRESVEPGFMALASGTGEFDRSSRGNNDKALAVKARRHVVIIGNHFDSINRNTLRLQLAAILGGLWVVLTPVQGACVRVHPEVPTVSIL